MNVPFSPPFISQDEIDEVVDTLRSGWITTGPKTKKFEKMISEYCNTNTTVCLNSATAALELTLRVLGIGPGDEVIAPAYTYTASVSVVYHVGATLKLVDCNENDFLINYKQLENAITEKTKAVIAVDIGGVPCDYNKILEIVNSKKQLFKPRNDIQQKLSRVAVIADGAHSLGAIYKNAPASTYPDFTTFSFHAVKNLTTAEGGAVTFSGIEGVSNDELYKQYQLLSLHGQSKDAFSKMQKGAWEYDVVAPYFKCNMTDIMASIGFRQLEKYDSLIDRRRHIFDIYNKAFEDLDVVLPIHKCCDYESSYHLYQILLKKNDSEYRNKVIEYMAENDIACNVHYKPLPMLSAYKNSGFNINDYPISYSKFINEISLPVFNGMTDEQAEYTAKTFIKALEEVV